MGRPIQPILPGFGLIFRTKRRSRGGRILVAKDYGIRAWPMVVWLDSKNEDDEPPT